MPVNAAVGKLALPPAGNSGYILLAGGRETESSRAAHGHKLVQNRAVDFMGALAADQ